MAVIHKEEDLYVAKCPEVGTVGQGRTIEVTIANLREATELYLEEFPLEERGRPLSTTFEATYAEAAPGAGKPSAPWCVWVSCRPDSAAATWSSRSRRWKVR
jgi:predicted RNase H-like HicB family nuclease